MTIMTNPKRGFEASFQFTVAIMAANALEEADRSEFNSALNLPAYAKILKKS